MVGTVVQFEGSNCATVLAENRCLVPMLLKKIVTTGNLEPVDGLS